MSALVFKSSRFFFDTIGTAALALLEVLEDARETKKWYEFGGLGAEQIYTSGLVISGEIEEIAAKLEKIPGVTRYDD